MVIKKKIKGVCHICGEGIKGNVDNSRVLECGMCVQRRVKHIERIALEAQMEIRNRVDYFTARKKAKENPYHGKGKKKVVALRASKVAKTAPILPSLDRKKLLLRWEDQSL